MLSTYVRPGLFRLAAFLVLGATHFASAQTPLVTVADSSAVVITTNIPVPAGGGTTYVLEKFAPGQLTLNGQITGGTGSILSLTTDTSGDTNTVLEFAANNSAYTGNIQLTRGSVLIDNPWSLGTGLIYANNLGGALGDLVFNNSMTVTNPLVLQSSAASVSPGTNNVVMAGVISGSGSLTEYGSGNLILAASNNFTGGTIISSGTLTIGSVGSIPGGAGFGNTTVNGTLDINGFNPLLNNLSGNGIVDDIIAGGLPSLTISNTIASTFAGTIQNTSGTLALNLAGNGTLTLTGTNTYNGITTIGNNATLQIGPNGLPGSGAILNLGTLSFNRSDAFTLPNDIAGTGGCQQNGSGTVTLPGNPTYTGPTLVNAGTLALPGNITFDASSGAALNIASGAVVSVSSSAFNLNVNPSGVAVDVTGGGTLQLSSPLNAGEALSDINFGINQTGTADFGCRIAANLDLGSMHRNIYGWSGENDVARNGLTGADCQFAGSIVGSAELTLQGQNSFDGINTMEVPFVFLGSNSFTGPLEIQRGSVYLGNVNALVCSNVVIFDALENQNSRLFLYGFNASISDLQSSGFGGAVIADGNNVTTTNVGPATLTVTQNNAFTFGGTLCDWYTEYTAPVTGSKTPILNLVKNGPAALTLTASNTYSGTTTINAGKLYVKGGSSGLGSITVSSNATLGGHSVINSTNILVQNKGAIETGSGSGNGNLQLSSLTLGSASTDTSTLNLTANAELNIIQPNKFIVNSGTHSVAINVGGTIQSAGAYPLITYQRTLGGTGFISFSLHSVPPGASGLLSNDTAHTTIDLFVVQVTSSHWTGAASSQWSTNTIPAPKNWVFSTGPVQIDYADGEPVTFDDTAVNPLVNISTANVSPYSITVSNVTKSYTISGNFGITGATGLTKEGAATLLLSTTNSYTGNTTISSGTLVLGTASAIPGGATTGNVTVNGKLDMAGFSPILNNLSGNGVIDNISAGGVCIINNNEATNTTFSGTIQNTTGNLGLSLTGGGTLTLSGTNTYTGPTTVANGTLTVNGSLAGKISVIGGAYLGGTGTVQSNGTFAANANLNLTANAPLTIGAMTLNGPVTVNVSGNVSMTNAATYILLNHGTESGPGSFTLSAVPGILDSTFTASLNDTNNQLQLVIAPVQPTGTIKDVRHVVIFMQENHSFDHYFGSLHGVHGFSERNPLMLQNGKPVFYQPTSGTNYELPFHNTETCLTDVPHDWVSTHQAVNSGKNNQWIAAKGTETMNYDVRTDLPYYYALADAFTICDEYHCSTLTCTDPNRLYLWTGMIDPNDTGGGPVINNNQPSGGWGPAWVTYAECLQKAGVSWKVYEESDHGNDNALTWFETFQQAQPGDPLYDNGMATVPDLATALKNDVMSNTLPSVSWIAGPSAATEHPPHSSQSGEALVKSMLDAIASNPKVYNSTIFILLYDENDGFFDHEVPVLPPAGTTNEFVSGLPIGLGIRVPFIIVSPWTRGGYVCSQVFDATSVNQFLEKWTGVMNPNITAWRRQVCGDLTSAFDFGHPNTNYPTLPTVAAINCSSGSTPPVPTTQSMPAQESGTLIARPLPYQPNTGSFSDLTGGNFDIILTNSGTASVHYSIYANAYRTDGPWPYDVAYTNSTVVPFSVLSSTGNYDFSCYGPNGFVRRFAGNINAQANKIEVSAFVNPATGNVKVNITNGTAAAININLTNNYVNSGKAYAISATSSSAIEFLAATNNGWYDLTATLSGSTNFLRKFAGHIETNSLSSTLVSSKNASGYKDNVTFIANFVGYGIPSGTVQFRTNGAAWGTPLSLANGIASLSSALLSRGTNLITAEYSGDALNSSFTNSLLQVVTNHPPVAGTATYYRGINSPLQIPVSNLLTNAQDVDGDALTLLGIGTDGFNLTTTNGAPLTTNAANIFYNGSVTPNVDDRFSYTVSDNWGGIVMGAVVIKSAADFFDQTNPVILNVSTTNVTVSFYGIPGDKYIVERSTNLTCNSCWVPISTNTAPVNGQFQIKDNFQDLGVPIPPLPPLVYYQLRYNP